MAKWIFTGLLLLISILTFSIAMDDQGPTIGDWTKYPVIIAAIVFSVLTFIFWFRAFRKKRYKIGIIFCLFPFALAAIHFFLYYRTQEKINKDYFLLATNPDEYSHRFKYYFRSDSTLKTHGFFWG